MDDPIEFLIELLNYVLFGSVIGNFGLCFLHIVLFHFG